MSVQYLRDLAVGNVAEFAVGTDVLLEAHHGLKAQIRLFCKLLAIASRQKLDLPVEFIRSIGQTYEQGHLEIQFALRQLLEGKENLFDSEIGDALPSFDVGQAPRERIELSPQTLEMLEHLRGRDGFIGHEPKNSTSGHAAEG